MLSGLARVQMSALGQCEQQKMISRNSRSLLSLAYPNICVGSWVGAKHSRILNNFPPPYLLTGIATLLLSSVRQGQLMGAGSASAIQPARVWPAAISDKVFGARWGNPVKLGRKLLVSTFACFLTAAVEI